MARVESSSAIPSTVGAAASARPQPRRNEPPNGMPYGGQLMFAQSWEDPECDVHALTPASGESIFAITSGGDNVLGLLLADPGRIISVDLNPTQTYLLELKISAFRRLEHSDLLHLLGVRDPRSARELYRRLRDELSEPARCYWDAHLAWFDAGLLTRGGFERYFAMLRGVLRLIVGRRRMERLFTLEPEQQQEFYEREWNGLAWRTFIRVGCSKRVLGNRLDPSWFAHAGHVNSFGAHFAALAAHAIGSIPARSNYFLAQIFLGHYLNETEVPDYLKGQHFDLIRKRIDRIEPVTADVVDALAALPDASVDVIALSNVFEYSPAELFARGKREVARVGRPGARVALRNLLARRSLADDAAFVLDEPLGERLRSSDRAFIYSRFEAAHVRDGAA